MKLKIELLIILHIFSSVLLAENKSVFVFSLQEKDSFGKSQNTLNRISDYAQAKKEIKELNFIGKMAHLNSFFNTFPKIEESCPSTID